MATSIYKGYGRERRRKRRRKSQKPVFKKEVIMLDNYLFKLKLRQEGSDGCLWLLTLLVPMWGEVKPECVQVFR